MRSKEVRRLLDQALACEKEENWVVERGVLRQVLVHPEADDVRDFVERKIGAINTRLVFSDLAMPEKVKHRIARGDLISRLAKAYDNTQEYILKVNGIERPELLRVGREIWLLDHPKFELAVYTKRFSAVLTLNGQFFKRYVVGLGKPADVPDGSYAIRNRIKNPTYRTPDDGQVAFGDPRNILGSHWLTLVATGATPPVTRLGLHGTWNESMLGRRSEEGRVRFSNAAIEELFLLLAPGTPVTVAE